MLIFGSGMDAAPEARAAAGAATRQALGAFAGQAEGAPKLAIVFASVSYPDLDAVAPAVKAVVGDVPVVGGTSGARVLGSDGVAERGVSVVLLGGDDIEVATRVAELGSPDLLGLVSPAQELAAQADLATARGLPHFACLVFAPAIVVDGEALVAAVRKGAGPRAQLAGALTGDEMTLDRPKVFVGDELRNDRALITGLFTRKPVGISARHGWRPVGPQRTVTRADGPVLHEIDNRPALDVWLEDARRAGALPPRATHELALYLANHYEIAITDSADPRVPHEPIARAPWSIEGRSIRMSGSIGEGRRIRVVHATRKDMLRASTAAAADAVMRAGNHVAGALVMTCSGRIFALGDDFPAEPAQIRDRVAAPIGGAAVFGEIAKSERDVDAFFNTTAVVVAFAA